MAVESLVGELPAGWSPMTLGEACERAGGGIQTGPFGSQLHASDYVPFGLPSIMPANIGDNRVIEDGIARITEEDAERLARYRVRTGDIVYSRRGDVERRALIREKEDGWLCGTGCLRVRFGEGDVDPLFASFYLGHPNVREWIVRHAHGATMPNLNTSILSALPFVVPPPEEQRAIAHILGTLDDKIELNRRMNETLEAMARAIFKSWFVDFDPVRAKASGEPPESICRRLGLTPDLLALFPNRLVDSELGEIPEGWEVHPFSETVQIIGGGTPKTTVSEYWGGDIPWFSVVDAPAESNVFVIETEKKITQAGLDNSSARILAEGTTIISARGTVGKVALVGVPMAMNQSCYGLRGKNGDTFFTYYLTRELVVALKQHSHGAVFDTITRNTFAGVKVVYSPSVVVSFESVVSHLMQKIRANDYQAQTLETLRDTLLPKLLSGELRVPAANAAMEATA
jgi:type I restriction enzyme S subunit